MLLYEYPEKTDRLTAQLKRAETIRQAKKLRKNAVINCVLAAVLVIFVFAAEVVWVKIFIALAGLMTAFSGIVMLEEAAQAYHEPARTLIYDDRLEHTQRLPHRGTTVSYTVSYEDILSSSQNMTGGLILTLREGAAVGVRSERKGVVSEKVENLASVTLYFENVKPKLFLINQLSDKIKYPKKEYLVVEDNDDETDDW